MLKDIICKECDIHYFFLPSLYSFDLCNSITGVEYVDFRLKQIIVVMWMCQYLFRLKTSKKNLMRCGTKHHNYDCYHKTCKEFLEHDSKLTTSIIFISVTLNHTIIVYYSMICFISIAQRRSRTITSNIYHEMRIFYWRSLTQFTQLSLIYWPFCLYPRTA